MTSSSKSNFTLHAAKNTHEYYWFLSSLTHICSQNENMFGTGPYWYKCFLSSIVSNISLAECYYTFNYKDHWDPGLFTCYTLLYKIVKWCCISWLAIGCSVLYICACHTHISNHNIPIVELYIFWDLENFKVLEKIKSST